VQNFDFHWQRLRLKVSISTWQKKHQSLATFVIVLARQRFVEPPGPTAPVAKSQEFDAHAFCSL
jgi:hypothetical protein